VPSSLAAAAWSSGAAAVAHAIDEAVAGLAGSPARLVLFFPDAAAGPEQALAQATAAARGAPVAGMTAHGLITRDGVQHGGCSAIAFGEDIEVGVGLAAGVAADSFAAGRRAALEAVGSLRRRAGETVLLLLLDPMHGDEGEVIDGAYDAVGGGIPIAGGGANGVLPALFADGGAHTDAVTAIALSSPQRIGIGISHGCRPLAAPVIVTRTDGRTISELDGRPAEAVYLERLGAVGRELDDAGFEMLAALHPLGQPALRGDLRLRHVRGRDDAGGLACAARIPSNAAVWVTEQSEDRIIESAREAVVEATRGAGGHPRAALVFDCAARRRALGERVDEEAQALVGAFGDRPALAGLYTRGEAGRTRGAKGDRNHAVVVVAFA
jgi:hypothetical protein